MKNLLGKSFINLGKSDFWCFVPLMVIFAVSCGQRPTRVEAPQPSGQVPPSSSPTPPAGLSQQPVSGPGVPSSPTPAPVVVPPTVSPTPLPGEQPSVPNESAGLSSFEGVWISDEASMVGNEDRRVTLLNIDKTGTFSLWELFGLTFSSSGAISGASSGQRTLGELKIGADGLVTMAVSSHSCDAVSPQSVSRPTGAVSTLTNGEDRYLFIDFYVFRYSGATRSFSFSNVCRVTHVRPDGSVADDLIPVLPAVAPSVL